MSGGLAGCGTRAAAISAECVQVFASAPQTWRPPAHTDSTVDAFRDGLAEHGIGPAVLHAIYLLNPASLDEAILAKTIASIATGLAWADKLGALGLVIHLGSSGSQPRDEGVVRVAANLKLALAKHGGDAMLLLETCAGQGNTIGRTFAEIGYLSRELNDERVGVCLDSCHVFAAGYDLSTDDGFAAMVDEFDREVGLGRLRAIHLNDSKGALGSNLDRHENIGQGLIGEDGFARLLQHPAFSALPIYLEVPGMDREGPDQANLDITRRLAGVPVSTNARTTDAPQPLES